LFQERASFADERCALFCTYLMTCSASEWWTTKEKRRASCFVLLTFVLRFFSLARTACHERWKNKIPRIRG